MIKLARLVVVAVAIALLLSNADRPHAQAAAIVLDESIPSGANFDKAEFRLWLPPDVATVRAVAVLVPGSNGDGRPQVDDAVWQASRDLALLFYEDVRPLRLPATAGGALQPMVDKSGFLGDLKARTFQTMPDAGAPNHPTAWLPTERVAKAWQAVVTDAAMPQ